MRYNNGVTAYRSNDFTSAATAFEQATASPDRALQQRAFYNLGNTAYRLGEADPTKAQPLWERALKSYETALALDPKDEDAKFNHDFVKKKLEELKKQQEQQQQNKQNQQDQKNQQDKQQEQNKDKQQQEQQKQQQDQQTKISKNNRQSQPQDQQKPEESKPQEQQAQPQQLDKQEAKALARQSARGRAQLEFLSRSPNEGLERFRRASQGLVTMRFWLAIGLILATTRAFADVSVAATVDRSRISFGESVTLTIAVQGAQSGAQPSVPNIDGLTFAGPSTQTSVSIVNGAMSQSLSFVYQVTPTRTGEFIIPAIEVNVGGKDYLTDADQAGRRERRAAQSDLGQSLFARVRLRIATGLSRPDRAAGRVGLFARGCAVEGARRVSITKPTVSASSSSTT